MYESEFMYESEYIVRISLATYIFVFNVDMLLSEFVADLVVLFYLYLLLATWLLILTGKMLL